LKKIVIIGPESTGKSTLSAMLAEHYKTMWVKEYAREYLLKNGTNYSFENLLDVAKGQIAGEEAATLELNTLNHKKSTGYFGQTNNKLFIDTDMYVMKVWCEFVFDKCHHWILNRIAERSYDLYLLCNIDMPWVKDELREYPDLLNRQKLYCHYKDLMVNQNVPWVDISGNYEERIAKAIAAVNNIP
jgi:NadR type nicotinamide-nucleotide adenylyltransferase